MSVALTSDSFDRADGALDTSTTDVFDGGSALTWADTSSPARWAILSNLARSTTESAVTVDVGQAAMRVTATLTQAPDSLTYLGIVAAADTSGTPAWYAALAFRLQWTLPYTLRLVRLQDGDEDILYTTVPRNHTVGWGSVIGLNVNGARVSLLLDGETIYTYTDGSPLVGTEAGMLRTVDGDAFGRLNDFRVDVPGAYLTSTVGTDATIRGSIGAQIVSAVVVTTSVAAVAYGQLVTTAEATTTIAGTQPPRTFALAGVRRGPIAYGPTVATSTAPNALDVASFRAPDLVTSVVNLDRSFARRWQDQLNEPGSGSIELLNADADLSSIADGDIVRFTLYGWAAFAMIVREREQTTIAEGEESAQRTKLSGPGHLATLDTALVYPSRGVASLPIEEDRVFSWAAPDFDDSAWDTATALIQQGGVGAYWENLPADWPDPEAWWIWANVPNALEWAPAGSCYFRTTFTVPADGISKLAYLATFDAKGELYVDGQLIASGDYGVEPDVNIYSGVIDMSAGDHTVAIWCENDIDPEGDQIHNPGGVLFTGYGADAAGQWVSKVPIVHTDSTWRILAYPPAPPGMTVGEILRHVIAEAQARGALAGVTLAFDDDVDSDGDAWPVLAEVSTKVGTDVLTFVRELTASYVDVWMSPASYRLYAWLQDGRGEVRAISYHAPTDPDDPTSGNLTTLTHRRAR